MLAIEITKRDRGMSPACHSDRTGKTQLPAVQGWGAAQNMIEAQMNFCVEYDNEDDGEYTTLVPGDIPLLGVEPYRIDHGYIAFYAFPDDTTEEEVLEDLDVSSWAFRDLQVLDE